MNFILEYYNQSYRILMFDEIEEYESIISELTKQLKIEKNSNAYNNLGIAHLEIGQVEEGFQNLNAAIELNPQNAVAYVNRAELKKNCGKPKEAEEDYGHAIELEPKNATYWRCRAYLRKERGELEKALFDFKHAMKLEPKFQRTKDEITRLENTIGIDRKD